jgi:nitroreductase
MQEEIINAFNWRAAVKSYSKEKLVDQKDLDTILEAGRMAPTAYGLQPFRIVEVKSKELREKLLPAAFGQKQVVEAPNLFVITAVKNVNKEYIRKFVELTASVRGTTVEALKGFEDMMIGDIDSRSDEEKIKWAGRQAYLAFGAMLETAALLGVDAGPMEGFNVAQVNEILGLDKLGLHALGLMALGYRENDDYSKMPKVRFAKEDLVVTM